MGYAISEWRDLVRMLRENIANVRIVRVEDVEPPHYVLQVRYDTHCRWLDASTDDETA